MYGYATILDVQAKQTLSIFTQDGVSEILEERDFQSGFKT